MRKIIIFIPLIIILLFLAGCVKSPTKAVFPTSGCDFIKNENEPNSTYTNITNSAYYKCEQNECIVSGVMEVNKILGQDIVAFRYGGNYESDIYVDSNEAGYLIKWEHYTTKSSTSCQGDTLLSFKTPNGYNIKKGTTAGYPYLYICTGNTQYRYRKPTPSESSTNSQYGGCPNSYETCKEKSYYSANFNFCPEGAENFDYCSGTLNTVSSQGPQYTLEYKLIKSQSISFNPKNLDESDITNRFIRVRAYDCSCLPAIAQGTSCSSEQKYCIIPLPPKTFTQGSDSTEMNDCQNYCSVECTWDSYHNAYCPGAINKYLNCDGSQTIGQSTCNDFGSTGTCPTGQNCYVDSTNGLGEGIGGCKCPSDPCILGQKQVGDDTASDRDYQVCEPYGECLRWSSNKYCSEGLIYDENINDCVCDPSNSCNPLESECVTSKQIRKCTQKIIGDKTCYVWKPTETCENELVCNNKGTSNKDDICDCTNVDECTFGELNCLSTTQYESCTKDTNNPSNSCLKLRGTYDVNSDELCINDKLELKSDVACEQGGTKCSSGQQCNQVTKSCVASGCAFGTETCDSNIGKICDTTQSSPTYNTCICKNDNTYCSGKEGDIKCIDSKKYQQCLSSQTTCSYWSSTTEIADAKICKDNVIQCPTSIDGDEWCDQAQFLQQALRCDSLSQSVEKCMESDNCYMWQTSDDCSANNYICVE